MVTKHGRGINMALTNVTLIESSLRISFNLSKQIAWKARHNRQINSRKIATKIFISIDTREF